MASTNKKGPLEVRDMQNFHTPKITEFRPYNSAEFCAIPYRIRNIRKFKKHTAEFRKHPTAIADTVGCAVRFAIKRKYAKRKRNSRKFFSL